MIFLKQFSINTIEELRAAIQTAIELEHSTIPPYLTANFTLSNTGNDAISNVISSVVGEEMLHLSIACNLLNAIGGSPILNQPEFIPKYPGPLPGGVDTGLIVPLEKFSVELVSNVFMSIEEPEKPIHINALSGAEGSMTIGQFYHKISEKLIFFEKEAEKSGQTIFTGAPDKQLIYPKFFPEKLLYPIKGLDDALNSITIIVDQGEGTGTDPFVNPDDSAVEEPAHYYRFQEIVKGKSLVRDSSGGYSYSGSPVAFDPTSVPNMKANPKMADFPVNSLAYQYSKLFNFTYTSLLNCLHLAFNGQPEKMDDAMGLMFSLRLYAGKLLASPYPNCPGYVAGPSFEFVANEEVPKEGNPFMEKAFFKANSLVTKISVSNMEKSKDFYVNLLGFTEDERYRINAGGNFGNESYVQLNLSKGGQNIVTLGLYKDISQPFDPAPQNGTVPSFIVEDIETALKIFQKEKIKIDSQDGQIIVSNTSDQGYVDRFFFFRDPDNNSFVIRENMTYTN
ncbi:ferritin-like domain-containing protein [Algoriphagus halophytocola]|uniref:Ferritin-like domain-containing protein n=1 Tax=Algoriphagus halophytocola TaxID=2991499 RepID=A0ABY6MKX4_9BACT|nr:MULTISPECIES: ferritin-like domain-containing protein [unclassified Algoriphagus]UZD24417.1 ferritin-like domain-containing protein [Algoriphagus sp. TR-M5]WBL41781.1 ferritin-like domain-containing protein [Algoriphagus sp. TR-M9]